MNQELGVISVATPCSESWDKMQGDAQVRACGKCEKNVYSLAALTVDEVRALVVKAEGKICWRFYVRKDGTVLTKDCPVGLKRVRQRMMAAVMTSVAILLASAAGLLREGGFWSPSQVLGSLSVRAGKAAVLPTPLKTVEKRKDVMMGGASIERY